MRRLLKYIPFTCILALLVSSADAASISCGVTHAAFTVPGQTLSYSLVGVAGDVVRITSAAISGGVCPSVLISGLSPAFDCADRTSTRTLPVTGTYTVLVTDKEGTHAGEFDLNLIYATPRCVAATLGCGVVTNILTSQIEQHAYTFNGTVGDKILVTAEAGSGACLDADIFLAGSFLVTVSCGDDQSKTFSLPETGTYVMLVHERSLDGPTGYSVGLSYATPKCATGITCGVVTNLFVDPAERHAYTFAGQAGDAIQLTARPAFSACLDIDIFLSGSLLTTIFCGDDPGRVVALPETGTYAAFVRQPSFDGTGNYSLGLSYVTPKCALPLTCGAVTNTLSNAVQRLTYTLDGRAGDVLGLAIAPSPADLCLDVDVFLSGTPLFKFSCSDLNSTFTLPATGTYVLAVHERALNRPGSYVLGLAGVSSKCGAVLNCGQTILDSFTGAGQQRTYSFYAYSGELVRLSSGVLSEAICPDMDVFNPAGAYVGTLFCEAPSLDLAVSADGVYTVSASERFGASTGSFVVSLVSLTGCFQLAPGSAVVRTQTVACLPLQMRAGSPVGAISFSVQAPCGYFANPALATGTRFVNATVTPGPNCQWLVSLQASPSHPVVASEAIGSLCFTAVSTQSAFVPITFSALRITNLDGSVLSGPSQTSRVVVVANQPLLETSLDISNRRTLSIFGKANTPYEIQTESALTLPGLWSPGWTNTVSPALSYTAPLPAPFSNAPNLFLRARER